MSAAKRILIVEDEMIVALDMEALSRTSAIRSVLRQPSSTP